MFHLDTPQLLTGEIEPAPPSYPALDQLAFLVGGLWVSRFTLGDTDTIRSEAFEWNLDRRFIRSTAKLVGISGPLENRTDGLFGVEPESGLLLCWAFTAAGAYSQSRQVIHPLDTSLPLEPPAWKFKGQTVTSQATIKWTNTLTRQAEDKISTLMVVESSGKKVELDYERRK